MEEQNSIVETKQKIKNQRRPKVVVPWSHDEVFKLIACVRRQPALWDNRDPQWKIRKYRPQLWDAIATDEFNSQFSRQDLMAKWVNLRRAFRLNMDKAKRGGSIKWKFFSVLQFLGDAASEQTPKSTMEDTDSNEYATACSIATSSSSTTSSYSNSFAAGAVAESTKIISAYPKLDEFSIFALNLANELRSLEDVEMARNIKKKMNRFFLKTLEQKKQAKK